MTTPQHDNEDETPDKVQINIDSDVVSPEVERKTRELLTEHDIYQSDADAIIEFVEQADPDKYKNVKYIMRLKEVPEVLNEFYPWVVTPGNRESKRDRLNRVHGKKDWDIADTWGMINDGNHRTIAKILANDSEKIECYVGYRTDESI
ncbi:MAG: hypothetical protein ABEJ56_00815 [Candidatus Nanohaloarchaea archaeon]